MKAMRAYKHTNTHAHARIYNSGARWILRYRRTRVQRARLRSAETHKVFFFLFLISRVMLREGGFFSYFTLNKVFPETCVCVYMIKK